MTVRTDLAMEAHELYQQSPEYKPQVDNGVEVINEGNENIKVTKVKIISKKGEELIGKPIGNYITLEAQGLRENDQNLFEEVCKELAKQIGKVININEKDIVLVIGLGNWNVTPDALGPKAISKLMVTRHLLEYVPEQVDDGVRPVCALAPGVLGITGMETLEIVKGIVDTVKPAIVIAIDALASMKMERVNTTIQIGDTGISPGSGVGNKRMELSKNTLGIPVVAIGVPTVVDAATIANDAMDLILESMIKMASEGSQFYNMLKNIDKDEKYKMIKEILNPYVGNLLVTPKEIDNVIDKISGVIANGLNIILHKGITLDDVNRYVQ